MAECIHGKSAMDNQIKCWNRPKRLFEFGSDLHSDSSNESPKYKSSISCISAITLDDSMLNGSKYHFTKTKKDYQENNKGSRPLTEKIDINHREYNLYATSQNEMNGNNIGPNGQNSKGHNSIKGSSLYSRITTGYLGKPIDSNLEISDETEALDERTNDINETEMEVDNIKVGKCNHCDISQAEINVIHDENEDTGYIGTPSSKCSDDKHDDVKEEKGALAIEPTNNCLSMFDDNGENAQIDQWRQVFDHQTGKSYYYNRRTRKSSWSLPPNAVLLRKRRNINDDSQDLSISFPKDVSISLDSTRSDNNETMNKELWNRESSSNHVNGAALDRDFLWEDRNKHDMHVLPVDGNYENERHEESNSKKKNGQNSFLFCMACGHRSIDATHLTEHMRQSCHSLHHYKYFDIMCNGSFHDAIGKVMDLLILSNAPLSCTSYDTTLKEITDNKENIPPSHLLKSKVEEKLHIGPLTANENYNETLVSASDDEFSASDDEDMMMDYSFNQSIRQNASSVTKASEHDTSPLISTCPFCSQSLKGGSMFSKHLLRCNARQKSCKKRTMSSRKRRVNDFPSIEVQQTLSHKNSNIQSQLLIEGGRHLPGYPKLENI